MKIALDLTKRLWMIDFIGSLPCTTELLLESDALLSKLSPTESEVSIEGIEFQIYEDGLKWNLEVEKASLPPVEFDIAECILIALKKKIDSKYEQPTGLTLEMVEVLGL